MTPSRRLSAVDVSFTNVAVVAAVAFAAPLALREPRVILASVPYRMD